MSDRGKILGAVRRANAANVKTQDAAPFDPSPYGKYGLAHFKSMLEKYSCIVIELDTLEEMPRKLAQEFTKQKIDKKLVVADELAKLAWKDAGFATAKNWSEEHHSAATAADGAIAETGQLVITSATDEKKLSLLADNHCVALDTQAIRPALDQLPEILGESPDGVVTLIAGASRTGDIEQTLILGAHGPRCLVVCLYSSS